MEWKNTLAFKGSLLRCIKEYFGIMIRNIFRQVRAPQRILGKVDNVSVEIKNMLESRWNASELK